MAFTLHGTIGNTGPRIAIQVAGPQAASAPQTPGINCLVDTGASRTAISPAVMTTLGLPPIGGPPAPVVTAGGTLRAAEYNVSLWAVGAAANQIASIIRVVGIAPHGCVALIGQDVLKLCVLSHNGLNGTFQLNFP
ncbi:retropepsin-like aspartic protease [Gimesia algae]|uniref:Peptidase A2 domain-containing protein n=1 Tax=Gimesia algae TaxID=2527971 RepID=A0A517VA45_9PLAN|nr:hypothetical protein Pan161_14980 [Gimesia algae]